MKRLRPGRKELTACPIQGAALRCAASGFRKGNLKVPLNWLSFLSGRMLAGAANVQARMNAAF
jgi:hypothetical protein